MARTGALMSCAVPLQLGCALVFSDMQGAGFLMMRLSVTVILCTVKL